MKTESKKSEENIRETLEGIIEQVMDAGLYWPEVCAEIERMFIVESLSRSRGFINRAALIMGVHRNTIAAKIQEYQIDCRAFRKSKGD
jgi:DNA-binding NtrC family response regulator